MECHGLQCGFCTPGMMMTARGAARPEPRPVREGDPRGDLRPAVPLHRLREHRPLGPLGGRARRPRRRAAVRGGDGMTSTDRTRTPDRLRPDAPQGGRPVHPRPGQLRRRRPAARACCTARSCAARTRTRASSPSTPRAAEAHPKVKAVITGEMLDGLNLAWMPTLSYDVQAVLATDKVRFQGQEVAFVVAEDRYSARDALELIEVEYEPLPAVVDATRALDPDAPVIRDDKEGKTDNHIFDWEAGDKAETDAVFAAAEVVVAAGHPLPARAPGAAGDLRRGRRLRQGHRQADHVVDHPGAARAPHGLRAGGRPARAQDPGHLAGHRRRLRQQGRHLPGLRAARSSARSSPASR